MLCALAAPIVPTGQTAGEAAAAQLIIPLRHGQDPPRRVPCPPSVASRRRQLFSRPVRGRLSLHALSQAVRSEHRHPIAPTINSIANSGPFTVKMATPAIGSALGPNETMSVIVEFNPTTTGNWNPANLVVSASDGNHNLACVGRALFA